MKMLPIILKLSATLLLLTSLNSAQAAPPTTLDYQGFLTDNSGTPIDGTVNITFSLYNVDAGGIPLWTAPQVVTVNQGVFSVELGEPLIPFPTAMFENPLWLGIAVNGDAEMTPRRPITSTGYAYKAHDANTLEGVSASTLDQSAHVGDTGNPHAVTAAQTGALSGAELANHAADAGAHHTKTTSFAEIFDVAGDGQIPDDITINHAANAGTVDGFNASNTPIGGWLLALDGGGKFPNSTLIMGPGSGLDADTVDGQHASTFTTSADLGNHAADAGAHHTKTTSFAEIFDVVGDGQIPDDITINQAANADTVDGFHASAFSLSTHWHNYLNAADGSPANSLFVDDVGNVGIGTTGPGKKLDVVGDIKVQGTGGFNGAGDEAVLNLGTVPGHFFVKAVWGDGIKLGAYAAADALVLKQISGNVGIGTANPTTKLDVNGRVKTKTLEITGGADLSEQFSISDSVELLRPLPGMVVSIDPDNEGALVVSDHAYNRRVAGIISGAGDVKPGMIMGHAGTVADGEHPVALTGRVYCFAETSGGVIEPGDLLTTSDIPGYAMKVTDYNKAHGAIIGKAMTRLGEEKGQVLVLVTLQ